LEKLFDAELRLKEIKWECEPISAKEISVIDAELFDMDFIITRSKPI